MYICYSRLHMKSRHSINQTVLTPLNPNKNVLDIDEYIVKPKLVTTITQETLQNEPSPLSAIVENVYMPEDISKIPIRSIFSHDVK